MQNKCIKLQKLENKKKSERKNKGTNVDRILIKKIKIIKNKKLKIGKTKELKIEKIKMIIMLNRSLNKVNFTLR